MKLAALMGAFRPSTARSGSHAGSKGSGRRRAGLSVLTLVATILFAGTTAALAATEVLDQQQVNTGSVGYMVGNARQIPAQTFTAGVTGSLSRASVYTSLSPNRPDSYMCRYYPNDPNCQPGPGDLIVQIRSVDARGMATDTVLASATVAQSNFTPYSPGWVDVTFPQPVQVAEGAKYALAITSTAPSGSYNALMVSNIYPRGGMVVRNQYGSWLSREQWNDMIFKTYVLPGGPADGTAPTTTVAFVPLANGAGWNSGQVTGSLSATDDEGGSGVKVTHYSVDGGEAQSGTSFTVSGEGEHTVSYWSEDNAGNAEAAKTAQVRIDSSAPVTTASVTGTLGNNGWYRSGDPVRLSLASTDSLSGVASTSYSVNGGPAQSYGGPVTFADGSYTVSYSSTDRAGNVEAAGTVSFKVDQTAPTVAIGGVQDGGSYTLGAAPEATMSAGDSGSGIESQGGVLASPATASGVGSYSYTASATDRAGNSASVTASYSVTYRFGGFQSPVSNKAGKAQAGGTLPVKFQLLDAAGKAVGNAVASLLVNGSAATSVGKANSGNAFRYDESSQQYLFNLSTKGLGSGTQTLTAVLDDGTSHEVTVNIK